ncbi:MAG: hypothetical protein N2234_02040 [Planctomycetota bacterium]|nr:hypothetical protein [Planctomycetota bacterium]
MANEKKDLYTELRNLLYGMKPEGESEECLISRLVTRLNESLSRVERLRQMSPDYPSTAVKLSPFLFRMLKDVDRRNRK